MGDSNASFFILSVDGGGIRGVFPAHVLACISERLNINLFDTFDMVAGTSTGSIVAAGIVSKLTPSVIVDLYKSQGSKLFTRKKTILPNKLQPALQSIYTNEVLKKVLSETFGDTKLGEVNKPLLIPATDLGHGGVHVFKSSYYKDFTRDEKVLLVDAVLASCSAPTYFDPTKVGEYLLADGGLWANNPSLACVIDAQKRLNIDLSRIRVLSLGTGSARTAYGVNQDRSWGLMVGWQGADFISFIMSLQAQATNNYLQLLLKPEQILRIDFETDKPLPLDDVSEVDNLISKADRLFTHYSAELANFLE